MTFREVERIGGVVWCGRCAVCGVEGLNWRNFSTVPPIFFQDVAGLKIVQFFSISVGNGRRFIGNIFHRENFSSMSHNFC